LSEKRLVLALFLVIVTLSVVATATLVLSISVSGGAAVACINSPSELDETGYGTIVMGKPKPGDWT